MTMSGETEAKCKKCKCVFRWHMNNMPFTDSEIVGTCENCLFERKHKCVNEYNEEYLRCDFLGGVPAYPKKKKAVK